GLPYNPKHRANKCIQKLIHAGNSWRQHCNLEQIGIVRNGLDALLQWDDFVVTSHYDDSAEFQAFPRRA
ncbi:MAG TPA: hypothetical protein VG077_19785, partial [Verrucomicrobiae bacterium]|nr:hypothetical protein [Verrucomicrobiae bacterium]